jgi:hypothetical protein
VTTAANLIIISSRRAVIYIASVPDSEAFQDNILSGLERGRALKLGIQPEKHSWGFPSALSFRAQLEALVESGVAIPKRCFETPKSYTRGRGIGIDPE